MKMREDLMKSAIEEARSGMLAGEGGPFGVVVVSDGKIISSAHNTVLADNDPTCHAEIKAISRAARKKGSYDLTGCEIYSTTEPCPMCFSAIHWARIDKVIFGTRITDVAALGFNELILPAERMKREGGSPVRIEAGFMKDECEELLREWREMPDKTTY